MTRSSPLENGQNFVLVLLAVALHLQAVRLPIRWHRHISSYIRFFVRYRFPRAGNVIIKVIHLYRNQRPRPLTQTSVGVRQVLSTRIRTLRSTSEAAHTSTTTPREMTEVSVFSEEYICADVWLGDRVTSVSTSLDSISAYTILGRR